MRLISFAQASSRRFIEGAIILHKNPLFRVALSAFMMGQLLEATLLFYTDYAYQKLCFFDCRWYQTIVDNGYSIGEEKTQSNVAFFPTLPYFAWAVKQLSFGFIPSPIALIIVSKVSFLFAIYAFIVFVKSYNEKVPFWLSAGVVAFSPYSFYAQVGYAESLYLLFSCWAFVYLRTKKPLHAGALGALLAVSRIVGVFFMLSYFLAFFQQQFSFLAKPRLLRQWFSWSWFLGACLIPCLLLLHLLSLWIWVDDALAFAHVQQAWNRKMFGVLTEYHRFTPSLMREYLTATGVLSIPLVLMLIRRGRYELAVFAMGATFLPLLSSILSMPRFVWWQAPFLLILAEFLSIGRRWLWAIPIAIVGLLQAYLLWMMRYPAMV